ncbi:MULTISPECIES: NAD(P)-binding protein [unclassified Micromonospora]|uniref:NAD(P)-binding protein n=1 Tax=unclassified Micromonospora TaxID=2617518 RepID=UPI001C248E74|nr:MULTISPECIES: NAD(P)-binding protein [unclassified Micromonospora]MBU8857713.1 NAD(P)-binding protein [Micromonospora sp. WMMB482]MDM4783340.1 NAD(P)-binding protein [Micromonospora sp. b486]
MFVDVVVVGAGPGGLACAQTVVRRSPGRRVLLLEAGRGLRNRPCPVDRGLRCTGCAGICNVISGFGGCVHYGDGVKLSLLPSGRRLVDHFGEARAGQLCERAFRFLTAPLPQRPVLQGTRLGAPVLEAFAGNGLAIREYPVAVLGETQVRTMLTALHGFRDDALTVWEKSELVGAAVTDGRLTVTVATPGGPVAVEAAQLVLATGRHGVTSTHNLLAAFGVSTIAPDLSLGVRLETRAEVLAAIGVEHPDLKITQLERVEHKTKTFCFCGGPNGGRIKFTNYQRSFGREVITLDGHETTERSPGMRPLAANFGLLCQLARPGASADVRAEILSGYWRLSAGRPVAQSLRAFMARTDEPRSWPELAAAVTFEPSVKDLSTGRLDSLFTAAEHASLVGSFRRVMGSILEHAGTGLSVEDLTDDVLVIGPEVEFLWDRVPVDADCRVPGLPVYVVGDAAGIAQGIVQAAMMGVAAGEAIAAGGRA